MMRELMTEVVNSGTGKLAQIPGYKVAGKTGTAQKPAPSEEGGGYYKDRWVCSFMGFAPADNPKIAMIVIIDEPKADMATGGMIAAPVFQEVTKYALTSSGEIPEASAVADLKAVLPVESGLEQAVKPLEAGSNTGAEPGVIPEFRGMTLLDALRLSFSLGQKVVIEGSGWVVEQSPLPGSPATEKIRLRLSQER
jgi:membrane peptidoglycan carboxypeptidase